MWSKDTVDDWPLLGFVKPSFCQSTRPLTEILNLLILEGDACFWSFLAFLVVSTTVSGFALTLVCLPSLKISSKNSFCFSLNGDLDLHDFSAHPWFSLLCPRYSSNFVCKVRFALKPSSKRFAYPCFGSLVGKEVLFTLVWMVSKT